jgi:hypothetical protein
LVSEGFDVVAVTRDRLAARPRLSFPARLLSWGEEALLSDALGSVEAVVHLAGESVGSGRWTEERKAAIRRSRVETTADLTRLILALPPAKRPQGFVLGSAIGIYGDRGDGTCVETTERGQGFLADVVVDWEAAAAPLVGAGVRLAKIRTGVVLDSQSGLLQKMLPLFRNGGGGPVGAGTQYISWVHLDDIVEMFFQAIHQPWAGPINAVAPEPVTNREWTRALASALDVSALLPAPEFALRLALGEQASLALDSTRVRPEFLLNAGFQFRAPDLATALQSLVGTLKGGVQVFVAEQWVPKSPAQVWDYFCDEKNLEELTPPFLGFSVKGKSTDAIQQGTLIDYTLSLHGIPFSWRTEIAKWDPPNEFVDQQLKGPYSKWHHSHRFVPLGNGTLLVDRVHYKLPAGAVGRLAAGWKVDADVATIFSYRRQQIASRFGTT